MKHTPVITATHAGCTCKRWNGAAIQPDEKQGAFTLRAAVEHAAHAEAFRPMARHDGQQSMFDQKEMFI